METKICCRCKAELPIDNFKKNSAKKDGHQGQCISCQRKYRTEHYLKNKQKYIDKAHKWKNQFEAWWWDYKKNFSCQRCPEADPICIDFHHLDSTNKEANIATLVTRGNKNRLLEELKKCIPLCSNCHRKEHDTHEDCSSADRAPGCGPGDSVSTTGSPTS